MDAAKPVLDFIHHGFNDVRTSVVAIIIALIAVLMMKTWGRLIFMAIGAVIVHLAIIALLPLVQGGKFVFPDVMSQAFWMQAISLLVGYAILIVVFFFLKKNVFKMG
ncbi:MAG: hypothetical protein JSR45_14510 [Proteobacteria bacterium]|nr:hypothetical protein [Pseudomonadota bacterium]